jgi:hypothetical protein
VNGEPCLGRLAAGYSLARDIRGCTCDNEILSPVVMKTREYVIYNEFENKDTAHSPSTKLNVNMTIRLATARSPSVPRCSSAQL